MNQTLFKFQNNTINVLGSKEKPMFYASQIAKALGYLDTTDAVRKHIWDVNKLTVGEYRQNTIPGDLQGIPGEMGTQNGALQNINHRTIVINEAGLYQLIFASKLDKAKEFQQWVFSEVLPSIRKTGSFQIPKLVNNQFLMLNERNLHQKTVDYIRRYHPTVLFNASLGEFQDTSEKRKTAYKMGYSAGMVDLMIYEHSKDFNGLAIEFKSPNGLGIVSENQKNIKIKLEDRGYKYILSDNYDDIILELNNYLSNRRYKCYHCRLKFKTLDTISNHLRVIHRK